MRPFDQLTEAGQMRRLRPLALAALTRFPIDVQRLRLVGGFTNVVFRVDGADGTYAIRVDLFQEHADSDVDVEVAWLEALAEQTDLDVARVVRAGDGAPFVHAEAVGVPGARRCTLFEWVPGAPIADRLTPARYRNLGVIAARLRLHGATFTPPLDPMRWDRVFYWDEDVVIFDRLEAGTAQRETVDAAIGLVEGAFARLPEGGAHVVHGDLHPWNVHGVRDRLYVLDFEDVMVAHPVQDVSIALYYETDHPAYDDHRAAFREGYSTVAAWPESHEGEIAHFHAARRLMFINYVLRTGVADAEWVESAIGKLAEFVAAYG